MPLIRPAPALAVGLALQALLLNGCGYGGPRASLSRPRSTLPVNTGRFVHILQADSLTVDRSMSGVMPDGTRLYVFHSVCTGSADGHCQAVDAFLSTSSTPIWQRQYLGVQAMQMLPNGFSVTATNYASNDPLCCPSLPVVTDNYLWNGHTFTERGTLPHAPGG